MSDVTVRFRGDTRQLDRALGGVNRGLKRVERNSKQSRRALQGIEATGGRVTTALRAAGAALVAFGTSRAIGGIVGATTAMEGFRTQLTTYLGSQELANAEIDRLSKLARSLPQDVNQLTEAFVIFQRFGLDTSNESMKAFSNIAAANSKSITQLGEAVADALTGEFERLKEFGIKVRNENGTFTAKIGEDQVAVAKSASALVEQLKALGMEGGRFGSVTVGPLTLAMSNFRGAIFEASAALGEGGFGMALASTVDKITEFITNNDELMQQISRGLTVATLAAGDAFIFLLNNLDLVVYAMGALIAIPIIKFFFGLGSMLIATVVPAVIGLLRAFTGLAKFVVGTLIRGALVALSVAFSKVVLITGAVAGAAYGLAKAWDWVFGTQLTSGVDEFAANTKEKFDGLIEEIAGLGETVMEVVPNMDDLTAAASKGKEIYDKFGNIIVDFTEYKKGLNQRVEESIQAGLKETKMLSASEAALVNKIKAEEAQKAATEARTQALIDYTKKEQEAIANTEAALDLEMSLLTETEQVRQAHIKALQSEIKFRATNANVTDEEAKAHRNLILQQELGMVKKREQMALEKEFLAFRKQSTQLEQAQAGMSAVTRLNPAEEQRKSYADALAGIEQLRERNILDEKEYQRTLQRLEQEHGKKMLSIKQDQARAQLELAGVTSSEVTNAVIEQMANVEMMQQGGIRAAQGTLSAFGNILGSMAGQNKQAFEAYKKLQIAQALISTYSAATKALAFPPGPPISFLYVAAAVAAGMAQVSAIKSQTYTGRQLGGPVQEGKSFLVGETGPEIFTPNGSGRIDRMDSLGGKEVNINFNIQAVDTQGFDELLVSRRGVIQQVISDAMLESGQRSRF
tara:strand:- start:908 stop:3487 length:2580 start_codon:yes stop_codon:yes gene_type:complete